ncbi:MAG TPA: hypothetical protein VGV38_10930 [Pyrinomonadaceae bacterium]|nr:hypothetical protein [Pyrinomonadaceae bacterium]
MSKTKSLQLVALLLATCATLAAARAGLTNPSAPAAERRPERVEVETVTLRPTGFDPAEITRPQGPFILEVDNRSGLDELDLVVAAERGERLREARVPRTRLDWRQQLDLRPGTYLLTEAGRPERACRITVTAR